MNLNINRIGYVAFRKKDVAGNIHTEEDCVKILQITDYGYISGPFETKQEVIQNVEDHDFWDEGDVMLLLEIRFIDQINLMHRLFHFCREPVKHLDINVEVISTEEFTKG